MPVSRKPGTQQSFASRLSDDPFGPPARLVVRVTGRRIGDRVRAVKVRFVGHWRSPVIPTIIAWPEQFRKNTAIARSSLASRAS